MTRFGRDNNGSYCLVHQDEVFRRWESLLKTPRALTRMVTRREARARRRASGPAAHELSGVRTGTGGWQVAHPRGKQY